MKTHLYTWLKFLIGWPFTILALVFIIKLITPQASQMLFYSHHVQQTLLLYGILCFLIFYFLRSYIWYRLLKGYEYQISFKESCYLWAASELKRYVPGNIWSFLGRTILFSERGIKKGDIASCVVFEAEIFVIGAVLVSALSLPFLLPGFSLSITSLSGFGVILLVTALTAFYIYNKYFIHKLPKKVFHFIFPPFTSTENFLLISISGLSLLFFGLGNYLVIGSLFSLHPQLIVELTGFFVFSILVGYLSFLTPAGFGVREGIVIKGLSRFMAVGPAAFAALFSRIVLIVSEVIFIGITYLWYRTKNHFVASAGKWIFHHKHLAIVTFLVLVYILYFTHVSFLRYDNFYTGRFDLGNMAQTVWNTSHGRFFLFTNPNGTDPISRLAFHADFMLILLAPFYLLWPDPRMLLLIQTIVVASGAFFVFLISKTILKNKTLSLAFAFAYLLNPSIERANLYDFHSGTLATTFLLGTYYFYIKKRYWLFGIFAILAGLCKEEIWLIISIFGFFLFFVHKKKLLGTIVFLFSGGLFYYLVSYLIPHMLGSQHFALSNYSDFGDSPSKIIKTMILSPQKIMDIIFQHSRVDYLRQLFSPLGYLSLFSPVLLIFAVPDLLINLLSTNTQFHQIYYQYTATISPFLFIAAIYGVAFLKRLVPKLPYTVLAGYLFVASVAAAYAIGPLPGSKEPNIDMMTNPVEHQQFINTYLSNIPKRYSVAASNNVGSHLSQRQMIYTLPLGVDKADVLVFLLNDSEVFSSLQAEKQLVKKLKKDQNYKMTIELNEFIVFVKK